MNDIWTIEKIVPGGAGMARLKDGRVGFAAGALPGERIEVSRVEGKSGYANALRFRVLSPAEERIEPPCAAAEACGGCDFLHVAYPAQLRYKAALIGEALRRTGGLRELPSIVVEPSPRELGYRSRIRLHIDELGTLGFYARHTHRVVAVTSCVAARPELNQAFASFREVLAAHPSARVQLAEAELRWAPGARVSCCLTSRRASPGSPVLAQLERVLAEQFDVSWVGVPSDRVHTWPLLADCTLSVPVQAFVQVNWEVNQLIVSRLCEGARRRGAQRFLDLYSGAGNFALALLTTGLTGFAVETQPQAVLAARRAFLERGREPANVLVEDAALALARWPKEPELDLLVLDPPRAGAAALIESIGRLRPRHIAYCSCDPVTLARDVRSLIAHGYVVDQLFAFDMFPGTHHVETLLWLRSSGDRPMMRK